MLEFEPGLMIWTCVSFGLLVILLYRVALPPLLTLLKEREASIALALAKMEENRKKADELMAQYKKQTAEFRQKADQIIQEAKIDGEKVKAVIIKKAENQAAELVAKVKQELVHEKDKIVNEVKKETAELVALASSKVLRRVITAEDNRTIVEESLKG